MRFTSTEAVASAQKETAPSARRDRWADRNVRAMDRLREATYGQARHRGLSHEAAQDSASRAVLMQLLDMYQAEQDAQLAEPTQEQIMKRAGYTARNDQRSLILHRQRNISMEDRQQGGQYGLHTQAHPGRTPLGLLMKTELRRILGTCLVALPPDARALLLAYYVEEASLQEIAARTESSPNAVKQRLWRARQQWRSTLLAAGFDIETLLAYLEAVPAPYQPASRKHEKNTCLPVTEAPEGDLYTMRDISRLLGSGSATASAQDGDHVPHICNYCGLGSQQ